jgi:hypothetical protein
MDQNLGLAQTDVHIVVEMEESDQIKVFSRFNKLALNAQVAEKK